MDEELISKKELLETFGIRAVPLDDERIRKTSEVAVDGHHLPGDQATLGIKAFSRQNPRKRHTEAEQMGGNRLDIVRAHDNPAQNLVFRQQFLGIPTDQIDILGLPQDIRIFDSKKFKIG